MTSGSPVGEVPTLSRPGFVLTDPGATRIPLFLSIIGIPFGWANLKMIPISVMPLGREIVSTDEKFGAR
ncbi:YccF domain-containing protein [Kitasatospora indigofera]|uniref:YccF domain-containing protein n=1 Tax=Kitasatospora indigofera TaxID=67307 RepID=UPI003570AD80